MENKENQKREILDLRDSNIAKLDVTLGTDLVEVYVQNNQLTELTINASQRLEKLDCTGNPMKYIRALAPGAQAFFPLELEASKGGYVGMKIDQQAGLQEYYAVSEEGYTFNGWYDQLGDRISKEAIWKDTFGASRVIVAWFEEA